jgi:hypothetical protein
MTTPVEASPSEGSGLGRKPLPGAAWFVGLTLAFAGLAATAVIGSGAQADTAGLRPGAATDPHRNGSGLA